jgi:hypothetical protein
VRHPLVTLGEVQKWYARPVRRRQEKTIISAPPAYLIGVTTMRITYPIERDSQFRYAGKPSSLFRTAEPFKMLDVPVWGSFLFSPDDKLVSVELRIDAHFLDSTRSQSELFGRFKQWLVEKYGKPTFTDDNGRTAVWTFPLTSIRLQWTEFGGHPFMAVTYNQANKKLPG